MLFAGAILTAVVSSPVAHPRSEKVIFPLTGSTHF